MRKWTRAGQLLIVAMGMTVAAAALAANSPSQRLASILAAGRSEQSVHYTQTNSGTSEGPLKLVGDVGRTTGIQRITFHKGSRIGHVTVIATPTAAYVRGDNFTLVNYMLFPAKAAAKYTDRWIMIPSTSSGYSSVTAGVTLSSAIGELSLRAPLTTVPARTLDGNRVVGVRGNLSPPGRPIIMTTLYAQAGLSPLPAEEVAAQGKLRYSIVLSMWNESINAPVPQGATAISVVLATH
jgi:hypothetical protein